MTEIEMIGKENIKSPLRTIVFYRDQLKDETVEKMIAGMKEVIYLRINCSDSTILKVVIPSCPELNRLVIYGHEQIKRLQHLIPSHIQIN